MSVSDSFSLLNLRKKESISMSEMQELCCSMEAFAKPKSEHLTSFSPYYSFFPELQPNYQFGTHIMA